MNYELLTIESATKIARYDIVLKYVTDTLQKAYKASMGKEKKKYNISTEALIELQVIDNILRTGKNNKEDYFE